MAHRPQCRASMVYRPCQSHRGWCGTPCLEGDVTGSPCQPWSRGGKRKGWTDARSIVTLLWLASLLACRPTWAIHENVPGFDSQFLARKAAQWYHVFDLVVRPTDMGFPIRRQRLYTVFISKTATLLADPKNLYRVICNAVKQDGIGAEISDCLTADVELILQLENAERSKRNLHKLDTPSSCWQYLLSKGERQRLQYYIVFWLTIILFSTRVNLKSVFCRICFSESVKQSLRKLRAMMQTPVRTCGKRGMGRCHSRIRIAFLIYLRTHGVGHVWFRTAACQRCDVRPSFGVATCLGGCWTVSYLYAWVCLSALVQPKLAPVQGSMHQAESSSGMACTFSMLVL